MSDHGDNTEASGPSTVDRDLNCTTCGYNLRGLDRAGQCPECGAEVGRSLAGDELRFADPHWLRQITRGATVFFYSAAALLLMVFGTPLLLSFVLSARPIQDDTVQAVVTGVGVEQAFKAGGLVCLVLLIWGCWLLTQQEPRVAITEKETSLRNLIRIVLLAALAALLGAMFLSALYHRLAVILFLVSSYVGLLGCMKHLQNIATRIPDNAQAAKLGTRFTELLCAGLLFSVLFVIHFGSSRLAALAMFSGRFWETTYNLSILALFLVVARALWATADMRTVLRKVLSDAGIA